MAATTAPNPLTAYRFLLRATRIAFQGDFTTLHAARAEARKQFDQHRQQGVDTPMRIQHAMETAEILRTNVVQGVKISGAGEEAERYELRIHEHIERGDNDSIKTAGKNERVKVAVGKACSNMQSSE
ncbi:mitochondrial complex I protein Fmp36 [Histoplasma capsulatum var. duboisii H88]|uniref:Mitochondrial zinc maintenance protein 1, mitochondrial n=1 Tax=Ajellomyces capsulatus (strain H88) TaxID=544711 RepID=A0A8A1LQ53_AJEC8|nr:mitochondrial complex I protein Fmp36 [Histoplasma capsulatum var. duboisii H88]